jgi:hypothetical protein
MRALAVLALVAPAIAVLPACAAFEKICNPGEVVVVHSITGGSGCDQREPDDIECQDGEILLKNPDENVQGCIPNDYDEDVEDYTTLLTSSTVLTPPPAP